MEVHTHYSYHTSTLARAHWPHLPEMKASGKPGGRSQVPREERKEFCDPLINLCHTSLKEGIQFTQFLGVFCQHRLSSDLSTSFRNTEESYTPARPENVGSQPPLFMQLGICRQYFARSHMEPCRTRIPLPWDLGCQDCHQKGETGSK